MDPENVEDFNPKDVPTLATLEHDLNNKVENGR